jgi:trk system potassium uptake protein TrkA
MYIVISGGGKVGSYLASKLGAQGHSIAVIEERSEILTKMTEELPASVLLIEGDGCNLKYQEDAGVARADVFVAVTGEDEDNLVSCQLAKSRFAVRRAIARVNNPKNEHIFRVLGIEGISSTSIISRLIEEEMRATDLLTLHVLEKGRLALVEITVGDHYIATTRPLSDLKLPEDTVLVAAIRGETVVMPRGTTTFKAGDRVVAVTPIDREEELRRVLTSR